MKFLRLLFFFILAVALVAAALSMLTPTSQKLERSITINAPAADIYKELIKLENFKNYSVWGQQDSKISYTHTSKDGVVGASTTWTGDPDISGDGKIEITALQENKRVDHRITFIKPRKGGATSSFILNENNGVTSVTWQFELATPRPWNIFNLFYSLEKKMGKDFDEGLAVLKKAMEKKNGTASTTAYNIMPMNFPATTFAIIRQTVKWSDLAAFYKEHLPLILEEAEKQNASPKTASGLFYNWDEKNQTSDVAAAFSVKEDSKFENNIIQVVSIDASKALYVDVKGAYEKLPDAYAAIRKYISENGLKEKSPSIEYYVSGPTDEADSSKWLTRVVFLVE